VPCGKPVTDPIGVDGIVGRGSRVGEAVAVGAVVGVAGPGDGVIVGASAVAVPGAVTHPARIMNTSVRSV